MKTKDVKYYFEIGEKVKTAKSEFVIRNRRMVSGYSGVSVYEKQYLCQCQKCHGEYWKKETDLKNGINNVYGFGTCGICSNRVVCTGVNDVATTHPHIACLFKNPEEAKLINSGSREKRAFICPVCGYEKITSIEYVVSKGHICCPQCNDSISYPNKLAHSLLRQLNVECLIPEFHTDWAKNYRYDFSFYKNGIHYLLEMDGGFHFEERFGRTAETIKETDDLKTRLAVENHCILIRIECKKSNLDYIKKNIEKSLLAQLYDLNSVDWKKIEKDCSTNLLNEIVKYYNNKKFTTLEDISSEFFICPATARTYLKRAASIGLIDYKTFSEEQEEGMRLAVELKKQNKYLSYKEIGERIGKSRSTVKNYLEKAHSLGLIDEIRPGKEIKCEEAKKILADNPNISKKEFCSITGMSRGFYEKYCQSGDAS